jgi:ankyrin repeat protein
MTDCNGVFMVSTVFCFEKPRLGNPCGAWAAGANLEARTAQNNTPLMLAVRSGKADIALNLIEHGAQANPQNRNGDTALLYAVSTDSPALVARLLDQGSDPYRRNELGESALLLAEQHHPALLKLIKEKSGFHFPGF